MPIVPFIPPQPVATGAGHGFDYVTVDARRRRVYAAHGGNASLLIVNADTGKVMGQVHVGPMAGVAVNDVTGNVYTGDGTDKAVSEVDPVAMKEVHRVNVDGPVDAIAFDPQYHRIYADEDNGTRVFIIDTNSFRHVGTVTVPGHKPEYLVVDPQTHDVYQNIATDNAIAVIDPKTLTATRIIQTPNLRNNHPLQFNVNNRTLIAAGENGVLAVYGLDGAAIASTAIPTRVDQCAFDEQRSWLACAASGSIVLYDVPYSGAPTMLGQLSVAARMHTVAIDGATGRLWAVWGSPQGDYVQGFVYSR
jgi:6-phosphogluconolactonase (cycloisomerase 2 family)